MTAPRPTALLVLPALALAGALLAGCVPGTPTPATPDPDESTNSSTPTPEPTETDDATDDAAAADAAMRANIIDAVSSGNTAALDGYFAPTVHVTYAASEDEGDVSDHALLVMNVSNATSPTAVWDFNLPASVIDNYRNNPGHYPSYVDDFPSGAIVGRSSEDKVISFAISGGLITRLFISNTEFALTFA
jgi:hypothetical protein